MNWRTLTTVEELAQINSESFEHPVFIFKHSTRCSISSMALSRLERNWKEADHEKVTPYYLDLIRFRSVSNAIAEKYAVMHQSPQVLVIKKGDCVYEATHNEIDYAEIIEQSMQTA
jgi:bacillithiol system protein YtxJ